MKKVKWIMVLMVAGFIFSGDAFAECEPGEERETKTGAVFTCDDSYPDLGEAWRDPSGLIWGDTVKETDGTIHGMNHYNAIAYCDSIDARLPSKEEFIQFRQYMGAQPERLMGYSHHDDKILPNLKSYRFWSSSVDPDNIDLAYDFNGDDGFIYYGFRNFDDSKRSGGDYYGAVRCVVISH